MNDKVKLSVYGITYSEVQSGAYALLLAEEGGYYRIPVVIGAAEAQSIAVKLSDVVLPRPLAHDLMASMYHAFGINLDEVFIYRFHDGVFHSELHLSSDDRSVVIDSRTSDAVALALRTGAPIYTTREILHTTGFKSKDATPGSEPSSHEHQNISLERYAVEELQKMLRKCVEKEQFERAAEIHKVINKKLNKQNKE
ncbi:MAG: bifunctional nuclease domain-containing protein [Muribaculaceae bacterium]